MSSSKLKKELIFKICNSFIDGRGFACKLDVDVDTKKYLLKYNYIYTNEELPEGYYFLDKKFYRNYKEEIESLDLNYFEKELIKEYFALKTVYFDEEIMHLFLNNPKFIFSWDGYSGFVCSTNDSRLYIYIKNLCLCYDLEKNKIVVGMFIVDLIDLSDQSQLVLQPFMIQNAGRQYEIHPYNIKNLFYGKFLDDDEESIYNVILEGIKIVNYIFKKKHGFNLFNNEYEPSQLQFYMPLFYPTKVNRFNFLMEIAKLFLDNINERSLKKKIRREYETMKNKNEFSIEDLKKEEFRGLKLLKTYFGQYDTFNIKTYEKLDEIRIIRTEPAHKIYQNDLDYSYSTEQDNILKNLYRVLYNIISVEDPEYKLLKIYRDGIYDCFYGEKGGILESNGFNNKNYHYYDGYVRLINDKFGVKDSEILIAGYNIEDIRKTLAQSLHKNCNFSLEKCLKIIDIIMNEEKCIPDEKELESFFYGEALIAKIHGKKGNYKKRGKKLYDEFKKKNYKYCYLLADSTDLYWNYEETLKKIKFDPTSLFGCGLLITGLTNSFSQDNTNLFLDESKPFYLNSNIWD